MAVTMREIAQAVNKPESTIYRWRNENRALFTAAKEYAERKKAKSTTKPSKHDVPNAYSCGDEPLAWLAGYAAATKEITGK